MQALHELVLSIGGNLWNLVIILAIFLGIYYGLRSKFIQFRLFPETLRIVSAKARRGKDGHGVSGFQAFCIALGGCIGTGNVAGVAMAVVAGGPGAVFWMWLIALLGMVTSFIENTMAQVYKVKEGDTYRGGPAYYMEKGLGQRWLGVLYAFSMIVSLGFALAALQCNTISASVGESLKLPAVVTAIIVTAMVGLVIFGGVKRIAHFAEKCVPVMTMVYLVLVIAVLAMNITKIPSMFALIFSQAFTAKAVNGAAIGTIVYQGLKRGVFSNGAGQGDAPTAGAAATVSHPAEQGMFGVFAVFVDTIVVCTATALVIIVTDSYVGVGLEGIALSQYAFTSTLGSWVGFVISLCIFLFCLTSILSNYYCGESCLAFLTNGMKGRTLYRVIFVTAIFLGGVISVDLMWDIADMFCALIVCLNMISIVFLGGQALRVAGDYIRQRSEGRDPVFLASYVEGLGQVECWKGED